MQPKNDERDWLGRAAARFFSMGQATHAPKHCLKHVTERCNNKNWSSKPIMGGGGGSGLYTWKPVASLWVTIVKISPEHTALLIHDENCDKDGNKTIPTMHRMTQHDGLSKDCPQGTCLLGQIIFDTPLAGKPPVPNILVFDVLQVGDYLDATGLSAR